MNRDGEIDVIMRVRNALPEGNILRDDLTQLWHSASFSGWLRGDVKHVNLPIRWKLAVDYCSTLSDERLAEMVGSMIQ